ncbi:MAG: (2Fe-2S)-binding protein [Alphaproteobacteria bacterium]|nr:(2Fe-2S)-binding protein [Alphaproteobacteria bacterium]
MPGRGYAVNQAIFTRLAETGRPRIAFTLDSRPVEALAGDTLLTAILTQAASVRESEFGDGPRAGLCLMGACQECWVMLDGHGPVRACTTPLEAGMAVRLRRRHAD